MTINQLILELEKARQKIDGNSLVCIDINDAFNGPIISISIIESADKVYKPYEVKIGESYIELEVS